jgi:hypothetical protein
MQSDESSWAKFFKEAEISDEYAPNYAKYFVQNKITPGMLASLNTGDLKDMGITIIGHCISILEYAKNKDKSDTTDLNNNFLDRQNETITRSQEKISKISPYLASIQNENSLECVTILDNQNMVTFAHTSHSMWQVGNNFVVYLPNRSSVVAKVVIIDKKLDVIWLKTDTQMDIERASRFMPYPGEPYFQLGFSATQQMDSPLNVQLGLIASQSYDANGHIRGGSSSCPGDSGGPLFDFYSGQFLGITVGNQVYPDDQNKLGRYGSKCNIVPAITLDSRISF